MTQPPGSETLQLWSRPSNGPSRQTDARILRNEFVGRDTEWMFGGNFHDTLGLMVRDLHAQPFQDIAHELDIAEVWYATNDARFARSTVSRR